MTDRILEVLDATQHWYRSRVYDSWVHEYLYSRHLGDVMKPAQVGYAPAGWTRTVRHLQRLGFSDEDILDAGVGRRTDDGQLVDLLHDRLVFPVLDDRQRVVGFIGRRSPEQDDPVPKYLNTRGTEVYQKGRLLYGLGHQLDRLAHGATPVIVEGPMDVWALWRAHKWAGADVVGVAPGGTALTGEQLELLARHTSQPVVVGFDADQAGRHAMLVAWDKIRLTSMATTARAVEWPAGQDPASMSPRGVAEHLEHTQPMGIAASVTRLSQWDRHPDDPIRTIYQVRAAAQRDAGHLDADGLISWISQVAQVVDADPLWIQEILLDSRFPTGDAPVPPGSARDEQTRPGQLAADPGSAAARACFPRSPTPSQAGVSDLHQPAGDWQVTLTQQPDLGR